MGDVGDDARPLSAVRSSRPAVSDEIIAKGGEGREVVCCAAVESLGKRRRRGRGNGGHLQQANGEITMNLCFQLDFDVEV